MNLAETPLAIVDLETTGVSPDRDRILEIGVICVDDGVVRERWQQLVFPEVPVTPQIRAITGISNAMVRGQPLFSALAPGLLELLDGRLFVAHNAPFDYRFLRAEFARCGVSFLPQRLCTVRLSRKLFPEHRSHSLDAVSQRLGIRNDARHRALGDAQATWEFLEYAMRNTTPSVLKQAVSAQMRGRE